MSPLPADQLQIRLVSTPSGALTDAHFAASRGPIPELRDGEVLVKNLLLSIDAANRAWMFGATYRAAVSPGDVMHGGTVSVVVDSRAPGFSAGDVVSGMGGWQEYAAVDPATLQKCTAHRPLTHQLSVYGVAGLTAYHGLVHVAGVSAGETVVVSAAAGSVGSLVGQIAKQKGARAIGIAGGADKCDWVVRELGFDACIDYKSADLRAALKEHAPRGVDVYFDNVGGSVLQQLLFAMRDRGRIACCGAVSQYDSDTPTPIFGVPGLVVIRRLRMEGFIVFDHRSKDGVALAELSGWKAAGKLVVPEDVIEGLENAPRGLIGLLAGENRGKRMIRIAADPA